MKGIIMLEKQILIINKLGLHARAAAKLIGVTSRFSCNIQITKDGRDVDAKSIMSVMMLAASKGTELTIKTEGEDQEEAMKAIETLINNRFDEDE
jgi:phosphocarrier protein